MLDITSFGGITPRAPWHTLQQTSATVAHNVKLRNGKIEAWRERKAVGLGVSDAKTLFVHGCCFYTWAECVDVTSYVTDWGRLFLVGRVEYPETAVMEKDCGLTYYRLGVPAPAAAPIATSTHTEETDRDFSERTYFYTYVNIFGEESAPSPVSNSILAQDGVTVNVTNMVPPPDGYGITEIHLYRTATPFQSPEQKEQEMKTDFLKVVELDANTSSYDDAIQEKSLGSVNNTREVRVPPDDLRTIDYVNGTGVLVGTTVNKVHFTKPYQPHNWPAEYDMTLPNNIINMVTVGSSVMITTDGPAWVLDGTYNCKPRQCRSADDVDVQLPDISCGYSNSAIATPFGMVYSSKDGLVLVQANAQYRILTAPWFSTDDWIKLRPDTVRLAYWRGYIICVTDAISFMLEIDGNTYQDMQIGSLVTISDQPIDMQVTSSGELLMMDPGSVIYQWNAGSSLREYIWESRELTADGRFTPTTAKIRTDGTTFRLLSIYSDSYYERFVHDEEPFRLQRLGRHVNWRVGFYGTGTVEYAKFGTMKQTINRQG